MEMDSSSASKNVPKHREEPKMLPAKSRSSWPSWFRGTAVVSTARFLVFGAANPIGRPCARESETKPLLETMFRADYSACLFIF
ncbi:hypothetical protein AVEN_199450-1 [Araneus ventricosus]|uniref:Uncharacterized protein n=1 Tax=Araneus ventricosus TaxID=182803 RepID=A0A4Y2LC39_ARAVE|nr:hypothetical protein AVEN_199450-1 [Araneus ventricosus]